MKVTIATKAALAMRRQERLARKFMDEQRQLTFTVMTHPRDWRLVWISTWEHGWDFRLLCLCWRNEPATRT